ncbi:unnamed protein product [Urochloa humidicola]
MKPDVPRSGLVSSICSYRAQHSTPALDQTRARVPSCSLVDDHDISSISIKCKVFTTKCVHKGQIWRFASPKNVCSNWPVSSRHVV